jgi:two-component system, cell cycle response regulator DivK
MKKLLLVEDNDLNRDVLSRLLNRWGYEVACAVDGEEGVEMSRNEHPDLVLMDITLPLMNGYDATRIIKSQPETCSIPVLAMTAHVLEEDQEDARAAGCSDFVPKPIDFPALLETIRKHLGE